jgi:hypothetical protein
MSGTAKHNEVVLLDTRLADTKKNVFPELSDDALFQRDSLDTVLRQRGLGHQELEEGIVDGQDDGGVDAVYMFLNGELVSDEFGIHIVEQPHVELEIFQVKNESGFGETPLQKLIDHLPLLLSLGADGETLRVEFNEQVVERFGLFRRVYLDHATRMPRLSVRVFYVSKAVGKPNTKVRAKAERLKTAIRDDFPSAAVDIEFIGAGQLNVMARSRQAETLELSLAEQPISATLGGMVALVRLEDYYDFIKSPDGGLREAIFEENVRGYEGNTNINKGIAATLQNESEPIDFWWLNNGVTVIGSRVQYVHKKAAIEDPQVVNGLQTSRAVFNYFSAGRTTAAKDDRHILVRVIEAAEDQVAAQIIKATNSQNRVPSASLRAAEPFQRSIEEYLLPRGRFYERRRNFYKNQGVRRTDVVSVLELAQAVASITLALPHEARGRPSWLVREPTYGRIFSEKSPLEFFLRCLEILDEVDRFLADEKHLGRQDRSNIRYHLARVAVALALASSRPQPAAVVKVNSVELGSHLGVAYDWVVGIRDIVAGDADPPDHGTLAKSAEFSTELNTRLSRYSDKQSWPKKLDSGWAKRQ